VSYRPDAHHTKSSSVRTTWIPVQTFLCVEKLRTAPACIRPDVSVARPNNSQCSTKASDFLSKIKYGKIVATVRTTWIPFRMRYSLRQVRNSNSTVRTPAYHGPDTRMTDMEIECSRSPVRTAILLVWTHEAFIRKLLAADVRPSERQYLTVRTQLSNRKDLERNFQNFGCTVVHPDGAQLYQARCSFEPSAYK
jgi:hypothetical protein